MTFSELNAEIQTTFENYTATGDIDSLTIKTTTISTLRRFGKNICDLRETIVDVSNSRALLPETFKSLRLALKLSPEGFNTDGDEEEVKKYLSKQYVENPVVWDVINQEYIVNSCESKFVTESIFVYKNNVNLYYTPTWLSLSKAIQKDTLDVDCLNLHPKIRNTYADQISITNRTLNTNFEKGKIYLQYNSLPSDEDGEIMIPVFTTGDIEKFVINQVKIALAEPLILNSKNPQGVVSMLSIWKQEERLLGIRAKSEANWNGVTPNLENKETQRKQYNLNKFNLPKINQAY
jgi:hypothetical protein